MKQHGEVALIGTADPVGDLGNGQLGLAQQRLGVFDPYPRHPRPRAMSATNAQDLKRFGKNTKDNLGSMSLSFDAVKPLEENRSRHLPQRRSLHLLKSQGGML